MDIRLRVYREKMRGSQKKIMIEGNGKEFREWGKEERKRKKGR
jgi:hypothetical protein